MRIQSLHSQVVNTMRLLLILITILSAYVSFAQTTNENGTQPLAPGQTIERELTGAETHRYKFQLKNEFFQVRVDQKGVDIALKLTGNKVRKRFRLSRASQAPSYWK